MVNRWVSVDSVTKLLPADVIAANIPDASATVEGIVELATSAETITGTDAVRAVTPAGLAAKVASTTASGIVELATSAETTTGTDTTRATTAAGVKAVADTKAALSHTHAAADIASGTVATARLGSGTADGTTFLRGDQTWAAPPGGGGAAWGSITGTLSSQTDLQTALDAKVTAFADPNADRIVFWDDSAGAFTPLAHSAPVNITGTALTIDAATETAAGKVELATAAETTTGTDNTRAVHPAGLKVELDKKVSVIADPNADRLRGWDDSAGAEIYFEVLDGLAITGTSLIMDSATGTETVTGTNQLKPITPDGHRETWGLYYGINAQTGTTYAPVLDDQGKLVELSNAGAITVTMPSNATLPFPIGVIINFLIVNTGMATFVAGSGATLNVPVGLTAVSRGQYSTVSLTKRATNTWVISGDLAV